MPASARVSDARAPWLVVRRHEGATAIEVAGRWSQRGGRSTPRAHARAARLNTRQENARRTTRAAAGARWASGGQCRSSIWTRGNLLLPQGRWWPRTTPRCWRPAPACWSADLTAPGRSRPADQPHAARPAPASNKLHATPLPATIAERLHDRLRDRRQLARRILKVHKALLGQAGAAAMRSKRIGPCMRAGSPARCRPGPVPVHAAAGPARPVGELCRQARVAGHRSVS